LQPKKEPSDRFEWFAKAPYEPEATDVVCCVTKSINREREGILHVRMKSFGNVYYNDLAAKTVKGIQQIQKASKTHGVCPRPILGGCAYDTEADKKIFHVTKAFEPLLFIQQAWAFSASLENLPVAGVGGFLRVFKGFVIVLAVEVATLVDASYGIESIETYLNKFGAAEVEQLPMFGLREGDAVHIPFGVVPIVIGVDKSENDEFDYASYCVSYVLDQEAPQYHSPAVRAEVRAHLMKGMGRKSKVFNEENMKALREWFEAWPIEGDQGKPRNCAQ
jgi:hypothetical protein